MREAGRILRQGQHLGEIFLHGIRDAGRKLRSSSSTAALWSRTSASRALTACSCAARAECSWRMRLSSPRGARPRPADGLPGVIDGTRMPGFAAHQPGQHPGRRRREILPARSRCRLTQVARRERRHLHGPLQRGERQLRWVGSAEVRSVLSSVTRASSCDFMALAAAAAASWASCSWRFRSAASALAARRSACSCSRVSCLIICCSGRSRTWRPADAVRAHAAAPTKATSSGPSPPPLSTTAKADPAARPHSV